MISSKTFLDQNSAFLEETRILNFLGGSNIRLVSSNLPFFIVSTHTVKSALNSSLVFEVGQTKSTTTFLFFSRIDLHLSLILLACRDLPEGEKSQSFASCLTLSALSHSASKYFNRAFAKVVFPAPGNPIIRIFFDIFKFFLKVDYIEIKYF